MTDREQSSTTGEFADVWKAIHAYTKVVAGHANCLMLLGEKPDRDAISEIKSAVIRVNAEIEKLKAAALTPSMESKE